MKYLSSFYLVLALLLCACSDEIVAPVAPPTAAYWELRLNHHAILLSLRPPHNSLQLMATPYTSTGDIWRSALSDAHTDSLLAQSPTEFTSRDSTKVLVSSTGVITARSEQEGFVYVVATRSIQGLTHTDSALVRVRDVVSPPVLDTFRMRPPDGDSAKDAVAGLFQGSKRMIFTIKDRSGTVIDNVPVYLASSNAPVADVLNGNRFATAKSVKAIRPGQTMLQAETWIFGVARRDSLIFAVGYPIKAVPFLGGAQSIDPGGVLFKSMYDFGPGAIVDWTNNTGVRGAAAARSGGVPMNGVPVDLVFDDSLNVLPAINSWQNSGGGNIRGLPGDTMPGSVNIQYRRFLKPGIYTYTVLPFKTTGKIVIHEQ